jgi:signal transduction histidine kinase
MAHVYQDFNKMSDELANVQLLRKDFVNSFSHEFKTPLASINGFASLMLEKDLNPEDRKLYLQIIRDETDRLSRLTSNTLLLTRLSTQEIVTDIESYDLGEQLRQCAILLSHEWMEKQQTFLGEFPQIFYTGNRELMQHLWLNLMGNAIRYTPSGGTVTIDLFRKEQQITVRIADTGQGMDAFTQEHLFDAYYRGDKNHTSPGLGLGLAIVRQILDLCQGEIQVQSTPGQGSVFTVLLPV